MALQQRLVAALRIVGRLAARRELVDRRRQVREEAPNPRERFCFGRDLVVDRAVAGVDRAAAERLLVDLLAEPGHDRRTGDEQLRRALHHHAVVTRDDAGRAETGDRAETARHDRNRRQIGDDVLPSRVERHERTPFRLERLHRTAAARAVDEADDRHPQLTRHAFGVHLLLEDRRVGRAAPNREIVAAHDDRAVRRPGRGP